jgi:D-aminopeptidase
MSGLIQVQEWGLIETPILLSNTLNVGSCSKSLVRYMTQKYPAMGHDQDVVIPLVGECDDSWLNDIAGQHVKFKHVVEAIKNATDGKVAEGCVGGGTGMVTCGLKAGIGTSSRKLPKFFGGFTIGLLVMSNFGVLPDLKIKGIPIGEMLVNDYQHLLLRTRSYGSIIAVLATDAPLTSHQLNRLAKRVGLGIGRSGSSAAHGSGEIIVAFTTSNVIPRNSDRMFYKQKFLLDKRMNPLYEAAIEATEEAIANSLCMAEDMTGVNNHFVPAIQLDKLAYLLKKYSYR